MTAEQQWKCRYWPNCEIHLGEAQRRTYTEAEIDQMVEDRIDGLSYASIAMLNGSTTEYIWYLLSRRMAPFSDTVDQPTQREG
jgi:hypothetical protein